MKNKTPTKKTSTNRGRVFSVGLVEKGNTFQVVDSFELKRVNQFKQEWKRTNSRDVARMLKTTKLVTR